ncbi:MAG: 50S ribosomal protein L21 [Candidatus Caenarcaniphilales bacterium]|nr:50S ribosomal protein L21 [Candidatus Caenarcaniphilales bacterium]
MYAIVEISGKQYKVEEGKFIDIDLQDAADSKFTSDKVLLVSNEGSTVIGSPYVEGAEVSGTFMKNFRDKKVLVYKMRPKKGTRTKQGHRQNYSRLMIDSIKAPVAA